MRRTRSRRALAAVVAAIAGLATFGAADAVPSSRYAATARLAAVRADAPNIDAKNKYGIPPPPDNIYVEPYDGKARASTQAVKIKTTVSVPESTFLTYLRICTEVADQGTLDPQNCPEFSPPRTTFDALDGPAFPIWGYVDGPIWVASPPGAALRYGTFPEVTVSTLAFGSVPVSATAQITQPVGSDGYVTPLRLKYLINFNVNPNDGGTVFANSTWPRVAVPADPDPTYLVEGLTTTGPVDVRISDLAIDGRRVDVGSHCRTATHGRLDLTAPAGVYPVEATASSLRGRPGGVQVLSNDDAGSAQGVVSIPAFAGCHNGPEDLDPLLTSFVSGPDNPVDITFTRAFEACNRDDRTEPCPPYPTTASTGAASPQVSAKARGLTSTLTGSSASSARWERLGRSEQADVVRTVARLPRAQRAVAVTGLPPAARSAVRAATR